MIRQTARLVLVICLLCVACGVACAAHFVPCWNDQCYFSVEASVTPDPPIVCVGSPVEIYVDPTDGDFLEDPEPDRWEECFHYLWALGPEVLDQDNCRSDASYTHTFYEPGVYTLTWFVRDPTKPRTWEGWIPDTDDEGQITGPDGEKYDVSGDVQVVVIEVDIDTDSDNDTDIDEDDDPIEEELPGRVVACNDDDDNANGMPDRDESSWVENENDLAEVWLSVCPPGYEVTLEKRNGSTNNIKVWEWPLKGEEIELPQVMLVSCNELGVRRVYVEGYDTGHAMLDLVYRDPEGEEVCGDTVMFTVVRMDADVDSDNTNGCDPPDRSTYEDQIEDDDTLVGKMIAANDNDNDDDNIPDFADGFNWDGITPSADDTTSGDQFVPLVVQLPEAMDVSRTTMTFTYSASDPAGVTREGMEPDYIYHPAAGHLRIWTKDGDDPRNKASVADDGHYVPPNTALDAEDLGFSDGTRTVTLYIEGIDASAEIGDQRIKVTAQFGSASPGDAVRLTVLEVSAVTTEESKIMSGAVDEPNHQTTIRAQITPPLSGCSVAFTVLDGSYPAHATIEASVNPTSALANASGVAETILTSSNTGAAGYSVTVRASVQQGGSSEAESPPIELVLANNVFQQPDEE